MKPSGWVLAPPTHPAPSRPAPTPRPPVSAAWRGKWGAPMGPGDPSPLVPSGPGHLQARGGQGGSPHSPHTCWTDTVHRAWPRAESGFWHQCAVTWGRTPALDPAVASTAGNPASSKPCAQIQEKCSGWMSGAGSGCVMDGWADKRANE